MEISHIWGVLLRGRLSRKVFNPTPTRYCQKVPAVGREGTCGNRGPRADRLWEPWGERGANGPSLRWQCMESARSGTRWCGGVRRTRSAMPAADEFRTESSAAVPSRQIQVRGAEWIATAQEEPGGRCGPAIERQRTPLEKGAAVGTVVDIRAAQSEPLVAVMLSQSAGCDSALPWSFFHRFQEQTAEARKQADGAISPSGIRSSVAGRGKGSCPERRSADGDSTAGSGRPRCAEWRKSRSARAEVAGSAAMVSREQIAEIRSLPLCIIEAVLRIPRGTVS